MDPESDLQHLLASSKALAEYVLALPGGIEKALEQAEMAQCINELKGYRKEASEDCKTLLLAYARLHREARITAEESAPALERVAQRYKKIVLELKAHAG